MRKLLLLMMVSGVISPVMMPFSTRQYLGSPSQWSSDLPSKIGVKPGSSPEMGSGRSDCLGTYCWAAAVAGVVRNARRGIGGGVAKTCRSHVHRRKNYPLTYDHNE